MHSKLNINRIRNLYQDKQFSVDQTAKKLGVSFWSLYDFMDKNTISRRLPSEANYLRNKYKPQFKIRESLNGKDQGLKIAGIMLYWAEGTLRGKTVDFVNSNPDMVKIFLKFLREICGVDKKRLRLYLYIYSYLNLKNIMDYWKKVTGIPISQFTKPYVRKGNPNLSNRKLPYGVVHIRYNDKRLLEIIHNWIEDYKKVILIRAGTQVAKGGRLCNRSVMPKDVMEK
ncbi:MAG: hypothetical protein PHO03_03005 [Candidatus Omnitrophica bacterium]|nr:hypothetical protein [Candidatus Omnitrophota bacterium]